MKTSSPKSVVEKLGYKPGERVVTYNAPEWFGVLIIENGVTLSRTSPADWFHGFFTTKKELASLLDRINLDIVSKGFWVSWPKKTSQQKTDITEQVLRDIIMPTGWVDTKVCAIDETWSGLKFLKRKS